MFKMQHTDICVVLCVYTHLISFFNSIYTKLFKMESNTHLLLVYVQILKMLSYTTYGVFPYGMVLIINVCNLQNCVEFKYYDSFIY